MESSMWNVDFSEIQKFLEETKGLENLSFSELLDAFLSGDFLSAKDYIVQAVLKVLSEELVINRNFFIQMLMLTLFSAVFTIFVSIFKNSQIADVGFYISYLMLITFLIASMTVTMEIAIEVIETITAFMKVFIPAFAISITLSSGSVTAMVYYETIFLLSYGMEAVLCNGVIPMIRMWIALALVNHISKEDILSKLQQLVKNVCDWTLKTLLTVLLGIQALQNLIVPSVHNLKSNIVQKAVGAIPGIGDGVESVTSVVLGGGSIIKNGVGSVALVIIVILCIVPLIKLAVVYMMFQITAAVSQPVADGRMVNGIQCGAEACGLFMRSVFLCGLLFFVTIALTCFATGRGIS